MAIAKKKAPSGAVEGMERIIQQIYDDINDIINSVNQFGHEGGVNRNLAKGKVGDIRVVKGRDDNVRIEVKTDYGWAGTDLTIIEKEVA